MRERFYQNLVQRFLMVWIFGKLCHLLNKFG